jgi:hypothetical protein
MGREVPSNASAGDVAFTVGIDAIQTVTDPSPMVTLRSFEQVVGQGLAFPEPRVFPRKFFPRR